MFVITYYAFQEGMVDALGHLWIRDRHGEAQSVREERKCAVRPSINPSRE